MTSSRGLEQDFRELYIQEPGQDQQQLGPRPFKNGLPSFKPVIYKNPADEEESDEDEEQEAGSIGGARVSQSHGYYGQPQQFASSQPVTYQTAQSQQVRLHQIPVQHYSTSHNTPNRYPNTSQSGAVYSGVASSTPLKSQPQAGPHHHQQEENDYVNTSNIQSGYYEEGEEEYIPPPVPAQASYGSVATQLQPARIKGPNYRIAPDVKPDSFPPYAQSAVPATYSRPPQKAGYSIPRPPQPEPVSSKLLYTSPVAPAARGFVQSHHKDALPTTSSMPPPPAYDQPTYMKGKEPLGGTGGGGVSSYSASYSSPQRSGLYNYTQMQQGSAVSPVESPSGGEGKQPEAEVDALTHMLMQNMEAAAHPDFFGMCARCGHSIMGENTGCSALDQLYHIDCFTCIACGCCLGGQPFFAMEGKPYCEPCYMNTLEKCSVCSKPITDRILRATGKPYHPGCFTCVVCGSSLDGVPFTVDATNQIHCIEDFHKKFAPRCCVCNEPIMPDSGNEETVRIVAMDRSFHVKCYQCEDCGLLLSSEAEGRGCYPLDDHILCKNCNAARIQTLTTKMTTEL